MISQVIGRSRSIAKRILLRARSPEQLFAGVRINTILDIGANTGQFAQAMRSVQPDAAIHSFEPIPAVAAKLRANFAADQNLYVHEIAISDRQGAHSFQVNEFSPSSSLLPVTNTHKQIFGFAQNTTKIKVRLATLDRWAEEYNLELPMLIKLDVQGNELSALRGARKTLEQANYLLIEVNFFQFYEGQPSFADIYALVQPYGFEFIDFFVGAEHPTQRRSLFGDALFSKAGDVLGERSQ
jgi:FkbM family methyltransferase